MKSIGRTAALILAAVTIALAMVSCGAEPLGMYPVYTGEEVTSTDHEFTNDDFYVIVAFDDGTDRAVDDFEIGEITMKGGEYIIEIIYEDVTYPVFVPINVAVYPSELGGAAE